MAAASAGTLQSQPSNTNIQLIQTGGSNQGVIQNVPQQQQQYHSQPSTSQRVTYISRVPMSSMQDHLQQHHQTIESTSVRMNYNLAPGWKRLLANGEIIYLR